VREALRTREGAIGFVLTLLTLGLGLLAPVLAPADPHGITGPSLGAPSFAHPLGTDAVGRDLLSGILFGARTSLAVSALAGFLAFTVGLTVGTLSGYKGAWVDEALMRLTEFFQVLPRFFFAVIAVAILGPGLDRLVVILGLTSWPVLARVVRAEVLSLKHRDFVRAAEAMGASSARVILHELLPNVLPSALVLVGLVAGQVILIEASLGFVGLSDSSVMSWGALAGQARGLVQVAWWLPVFPGLAIAGAVLGLNLLCDALSARLGGR
jgi:peptide/nickel transport system permease protein